MRKFIVMLVAMTAMLAAAQTVVPYNDIALGNANGIAVVLSNANVRVCSVPTSTNPPCTTPLTNMKKLAPDGTCSTTTQPNPMTSDASGNYSFCAPAGYYVVETSKQRFGTVRVPIVMAAVGGGTGGLCATGQVVTGINPDGTPVCGSAGSVVSAPHTILSTTHTDTTPATVLQGDMMVGVLTGGTTTWQRVAKGAASYCWQMDPTGTFPEWAACPSTAPTANPKVVPPPPYQVPIGQQVAWAFPSACSITGDLTLGSATCGQSSGFLERLGSCPFCGSLGLHWSGFSMPTLPGDAAIQNIYAVAIGSKQIKGTISSLLQISCSGNNFYNASTDPWWGLIASTTLGSTVPTVTGATCDLNTQSTVNFPEDDVITVQVIALAIYYTTATPPATDYATFFMQPYYGQTTGIQIPFTSVADASPIAINYSSRFIQNNYSTLNHLVATRALNVSGMQSGGVYTFAAIQDGTGGAALTGGTGCTWQVNNAATTTLPVSTSASAISYFTWRYDGTNCLVDFPVVGGGGGGLADPGGNGIIKRTALNVTAPAVGADINTALGYTAADDSTVIHKTGAESAAGVKTFSNGIIIPGGASADIGGLGFNGLQTEYVNLNGGTAPTITSGCGTSPTITGFDNAFTITGGTGTFSTCTVTFFRTWDHVPACTVNNRGVLAATRATPTTTTVVIDSASNFAAGGKIDAICY